jgi:hypothetical protein
MQLKLVNPRKMNKNTLRGFFDLEVGPLLIEGYSFHKKNEKQWVNPPSREYQDKQTGETRYAPIIRVPDRDRYWKFQELCVGEAQKLFDTLPDGGEQSTDDSDIPF